MTDNPKVDAIIEEAGLSGITSVSKNNSGYASQSYLVTCDSGDLVVLVPKVGGRDIPDYAYHYVILQQLATIDYPYAPRPVHLAEDHIGILVTKVAGEPSVWLNEAPGDQQRQAVRLIIDALLELNAVSYNATATAYKELTGKTLDTIKIQDNVKKFQTDWLLLADEKGHPDKIIRDWLIPRVRKCENYVRNFPPGNKIVFVHGDTVAPNVFMTKDMQLSFIDWDSSGFDQYPEQLNVYNLGYILLQVPYFRDNQEYAINYLAHQGGFDVVELKDRISVFQEITQIGDVVWAYMMHARAVTGDVEGDPAKFMKIAHERIAYYEEHFGNSNLLQ